MSRKNRNRVGQIPSINNPPSIPGRANYIYTRLPPSTLANKIVPTPSWFSQNEPNQFNVSIIIPLFRSAQEISKQVHSWQGVSDLTKEIIYVDDNCPDDSSYWVIKSWEDYLNRWNGMKSVCGSYQGYIGKIIKMHQNSGYACACNTGASIARGRYLIFLHSDVITTTGWMDSLIDVISSNADAGIVGNLHLNEDGTIDSAGKEWHGHCFEDIGKDVWNGKRLDRLITQEELIPGIEERQAVGGCCMAVSKEVFNKVGGFDNRYRFVYWEQEDFNLKVREVGHKIYFQPASVVYHKGNHSEANLHPYLQDNYSLFKNQWIDSGRLARINAI